MSVRLVGLTEGNVWDAAVRGLPHAPAHTHWYNAALSASVADEIVLFEFADGADRAVCPLLLRRYEGTVDVATPYGFSGFATFGACRALPEAFRRFAREAGWICGYVALHPLLAHPFGADDGVQALRTVYTIDLARSGAELLAAMHPTTRNELRREAGRAVALVFEQERLAAALPALYAETRGRTGASERYDFSARTLRDWLAAPGAVAVGAGDPIEAVVVCLHADRFADYFINAAVRAGRSHTRRLLWAAMAELQRRGVRYLNLGGGVREGDDLEAFKRRFGGAPTAAPVLRQVYDERRFSALAERAGVASRDDDFFPPYRAGT